ncbi:uncharacterized protein EMH_0085670 [Eimeria mitis]|uniref:Uncharacterized protein n=1 Tax=Eimeria mitis TaxID=44415 RepID=U6K764_9EIME|nr:uncharacterized protein EMH_0085670 [Eimeria mitis]CDJ33825.1 hypothetical protein EMH_0085670 [Eimeria mitis]
MVVAGGVSWGPPEGAPGAPIKEDVEEGAPEGLKPRRESSVVEGAGEEPLMGVWGAPPSWVCADAWGPLEVGGPPGGPPDGVTMEGEGGY